MKGIIKSLVKTDTNNLSALVARLALAWVMLPHGLQKTFGWFGGYGFSGTLGFFTQTIGVPTVVAVLVIMGESLGSLSIALGFLTRFCAASLALIMLGAIATVHWNNGFFMNWTGQKPGEGFEYHLLAIGLALVLVISGGGKYSVDGKISEMK